MRPRIAAAVALLVGVVSVAGCAAAGTSQPAVADTPGSPAAMLSPSPTPVATPTLVPAPTPTPMPTVEEAGATRIPVSGFVDWLVMADGTAWLTNATGIVRLDPETGAPGETVPIEGSTCTALDEGYGSVWAATCENHSLTRIDPVAREVVTRIELPTEKDVAEEGSVAAGEGGVWVVTTDPLLVKVSPKRNEVEGTWPLPPGAAAVRAGLGWLWVTVPEANQLLRIDPADPTTMIEIPVGGGPRFLAVGEDAVWTMDARDGTVTKVLEDGSVAATIKVADQPIRGGDITVGGGSVWARTWDSLVVRIDPETGETLRLGPRSGSGSVAADEGAAWISAHDVSAVWRLPLPVEEP